MKIRACIATSCFLLISSPALAQSTSIWRHVPTVGTSGTEVAPEFWSRGEAYVSIYLHQIVVRTESSWYTKFITLGTNEAKAYATLGVIIRRGTFSFADTRISHEILIENGKTSELSWGRSVINDLPTTFDSVVVDVRLNAKAKDNLNSAIQTAVKVSEVAPYPPLSAILDGFVSPVKSLLDVIFQEKLLETRLQTSREFSPTQDGHKPGFYVVFGADQMATYLAYDKIAYDAAKGVLVDGSGKAVDNLSYAMLEIRAKKRKFRDHSFAPLSLDSSWAKVVKLAYQRALCRDQQDCDDAKRDIREMVQNASALIFNDVDLVFQEAIDIFQAQQVRISEIHNAHMVKIRKQASADGNKLYVQGQVEQNTQFSQDPGLESQAEPKELKPMEFEANPRSPLEQ